MNCGTQESSVWDLSTALGAHSTSMSLNDPQKVLMSLSEPKLGLMSWGERQWAALQLRPNSENIYYCTSKVPVIASLWSRSRSMLFYNESKTKLSCVCMSVYLPTYVSEIARRLTYKFYRCISKLSLFSDSLKICAGRYFSFPRNGSRWQAIQGSKKITVFNIVPLF